MDASTIHVKNGWIYVTRELADAIGALQGATDFSGLAALTAISTADATDPATAQALTNANKAKINQIITALKALGA